MNIARGWVGVFLLLIVTYCCAQSYPSRGIRIIVPATPGGGTDLLARQISVKLTDTYSQQVIVENRAGGGGIIGSDYVARSAPDGYTLLMAFTSHVTNPSLYQKMPYDTVNDFASISLIAVIPSIVVVHPAVPVSSIKELLALSKRRRDQPLTYSSAGIGSASHLAVELLAHLSGTRFTHIPYKGTSPALVDIVSGHVSLMIGVIPSTLPYIKINRLKALAVTSAQRSKIVPELPTIDESGMPGYESAAWFALLAPTKTAEQIIAKLNVDVRRILNSPEVREKLLTQGAELQSGSAADLDRRIRNEIEKWGKIIRSSGARAE